MAAGLLKRGRYRSGMVYLYALRAEHIRRGHPWCSTFRQLYASYKRSLERGLGPARHAAVLPVEKLCDVSGKAVAAAAKRPYWPAAGVDAIVVACAWGCREVESGSVFLASVEIHESTESVPLWASWELPASKADPKALGKTRALACACPASTCPVCAMKRVVAVSRRSGRRPSGTARRGAWKARQALPCRPRPARS